MHCIKACLLSREIQSRYGHKTQILPFFSQKGINRQTENPEMERRSISNSEMYLYFNNRLYLTDIMSIKEEQNLGLSHTKNKVSQNEI